MVWRYDGTLNKAVQTSAPVTTVPLLNDGQQKAFVQLDILLRQDGATGNIRDSYTDTTALFADWRQRMYLPPPPRYDTPVANRPATNLPLPDGIDQCAWEAVTWQIYWEIVWVQHVQDWFGNKIGTLLTDGAIGKTLTLQAVGDKLNIGPDNGVSLAFNIMALIAAAMALAAASAEAPAAAAAAAGFLSAIFKFIASELPGGGSGFQIEYNKLQQQLVNTFTKAATENDNFQLGVLGSATRPADYGLLKAIGQMIDDTTWSWPLALTNNLVDALLRSFAISIWQALEATTTWEIWTVRPPPRTYPDQYILKTSEIGWYWLCYDNLTPFDIVPPDTLKALFDPHEAGNIFPLGVPLADVFEGKNGWPRFPYNCSMSGFECDPPPGYTSLPSRFAAEPTLYPQVVLSRDGNTQEILVAVTIYNQGLTAARNVEITDASLNGRKDFQTGLQTNVHQGDPQTILLRFPNIPKTTTANLKILGSYLGGKFDTTTRVDVP
jgi:hypothetical protein